MRLFSNRSQMTSKCGKNKEVGLRYIAVRYNRVWLYHKRTILFTPCNSKLYEKEPRYNEPRYSEPFCWDGPWIFFVLRVYGNTMTVFNYNSRQHGHEFLWRNSTPGEGNAIELKETLQKLVIFLLVFILIQCKDKDDRLLVQLILVITDLERR